MNRHEAAAHARPWEESTCGHSATARAPAEPQAREPPRRAEPYSDLSTCQVKPEKTSWPARSLEPDKIPPELQPDIPEASAEFHFVSDLELSSLHREPSCTGIGAALCRGIPAASWAMGAFQHPTREAG